MPAPEIIIYSAISRTVMPELVHCVIAIIDGKKLRICIVFCVHIKKEDVASAKMPSCYLSLIIGVA
jgi:hypothetical protein